MGFFSWKCRECGQPIMSPYDVPSGLHWMNECVVLGVDGEKVIGNYDGYGRVITDGKGKVDISDYFPDMYHQDCYLDQEYSGESERAECQGYFWTMCDYLDWFRGKIPGEIEYNCKEEDYSNAWVYHEGEILVD